MILFQCQTPELKVTVDAYFQHENLVIEGYDIGKTVEEFWGDSDYEYTTTVFSEEVKKLYSLFNIPEHQDVLLEAMSKQFNMNTCFSDFRNFCDDNDVKYEGFSWT